ncbi:DUF4183 domain-containing protein [Fictibacillus nanhaiensis]|uniref:DUF4183 domain-containing protein n=1 Tax=Fictibacillus nanhaiensis TaxID=742169 RepID=UPI001C961818|nr:DUF4183 domain-containing protein [Fictibacillus nanhaiensis]MBY6037270.1 DUF4183 domain-containing protein [Fictibacillus nanhaiensis]
MPIIKPYYNVKSRRYASTIGSGTGTGGTFAIAATAFTTDTGAAATAFPSTYAYYNLYLNAMIQTADTSSVTTSSVSIPGGDTLDAATPVILEFVVT